MTQPPSLAVWGRPARDLFYLHDAFGTLFAAEVVLSEQWDDALRQPPDRAEADVRLVLLAAGELPRSLPGWLAVSTARPDEATEQRLAQIARRLWLQSPYHRAAGALPEDYVRAGFHALCPPHPPCPLGTHARGSVAAFARGRPQPLGRLAEEGRDGFDRWLRVAWRDPEAFARSVLLARIDDAGIYDVAELVRRFDAAEVDADGGFATLAKERADILARLDPRRYFERPVEFARTAVDAERWLRRYGEAYAEHARRVSVAARGLLQEVEQAEAAARALRVLNRSPDRGMPVGEDALARFEAGLRELREWAGLPSGVPPADLPGLRLVVGRAPATFAEVRLTAAAVLAAVDVQRRRVPV
ncbi:MAG: hypothetical protein WD734_06205 [Dehalococcoidia bacterium]